MIDRLCIRCHHPLQLEEGQLGFCSACGAPQIFLSEELQEQTLLDAQRDDERAPQTPALPPDQTGTQPPVRSRSFGASAGTKSGWSLAVRYALLSSGIALALSLGGVVFAPLLFLAWLWIVSAPILTVGFYNTKSLARGLSAGFAAKLGLLTGLLVSACCAIVFTGGLLLDRYVFHGGAVDTQVASAIAQLRGNVSSQYGDAAQPILGLLGVPEFRVGLVLWMGAVTVALYLVVSMATAGVAGLLLARRRPA